jgi:drug/metabolite transporter (DMT)-like permease
MPDRKTRLDGVAVAALLWGGTTQTIRASRLATASPEQTLQYQPAVSGVLLVCASLITGETWPVHLVPRPLGLMAFQTVAITFASYLLWFWLVRHCPATQVASFTLLTPLCGLPVEGSARRLAGKRMSRLSPGRPAPRAAAA